MAVSNNLGMYLPTRDDYISVKRDISDNLALIDAAAGNMDIIVNGNTASVNVTSGQFVTVLNSTITGVTDGIYKAVANVAAGVPFVAANLTSPTSGALNELVEQIVPQDVNITKNTTDWSTNSTKAYRIGKLVIVNPYVIGTPTNGKTICSGLPVPKNAFTLYGNPCGILSVDANGVLSVQSAGSASAVFFGQSIVYPTSV